MVKFYKLDENGKVSYTEEEFKEIIQEVYNEGYKDGRKEDITITTQPNTPSWTTTVPYGIINNPQTVEPAPSTAQPNTIPYIYTTSSSDLS